MPQIEVKAPDDRAITITGRNTRTGQDSGSVVIAAGKTGFIDVDALNEAVVSTVGVEGDIPSQTPHAATVEQAPAEAEKAQLRHGEDADVVAAMKGLPADAARTRDGYLTTEVINAALADQGIEAINASRRTSLSDANGLVKAAG